MAEKLIIKECTVVSTGKTVEVGQSDIVFVVIPCIATKELLDSKLDQLTLVPCHKALTGIEIPISAIKEAEIEGLLFSGVSPTESTKKLRG